MLLLSDSVIRAKFGKRVFQKIVITLLRLNELSYLLIHM